jgi:hypothetical protein
MAARVRKANCVHLIPWTTIQVKNLDSYTCGPDDCIKERLDTHMLDLDSERVYFGSTVLIDGVVDEVWLVGIWVCPHPCTGNELCPKSADIVGPLGVTEI